MKTLNLVYPDKSDIKYKISKFPDGQQNIVINNLEKELVWADWHPIGGGSLKKWSYPSVQIKSRLNNWLDLELITCAVAALRELEVQEIHLYVPYIIGARSDRKFEEGGNNYLKDVICPIINSLNFKTVTCIDPHSDCLEMGIKGFKKESNLKLIPWALAHIGVGHTFIDYLEKFNLISPDAGATKKIYKLADQIGYKGDIITCSKHRDIDGKLGQTYLPYMKHCDNKDMIIIDDICDGGATFINIAKALKEEGYKLNKLYLIVTHGIFSKGFTELSKYFDGIYCTNSYSDIDKEWYSTEDGKQDSGVPVKKTSDLVKQLNVF